MAWWPLVLMPGLIWAQAQGPVANAGVDRIVHWGDQVTLNGEGSTFAGAKLAETPAYLWSLTVPNGSAAELTSTSLAAPTFVVDVIGVYTASLEVGNDPPGGGPPDWSHPSSVTVTAISSNLAFSDPVEIELDDIFPPLVPSSGIVLSA